MAVTSETIVTNEKTGGKKGTKPARYDLIPTLPLKYVAEVYGVGARKYADRNWELGYNWSLSFAAMMRHAQAFWGGQDYDVHEPTCLPSCVEHTEAPHLAQAAWHCFALLEFMRTHPELDDRSKNNGKR